MQEVKDYSIKYPLVTVLMSVHNGQVYLNEAVESILHQSYSNFEFIIIDDGSTDASWEMLTKLAVSDCRISLIRNECNIGLAKSLNRGLALAKGEFIARIDADDLSGKDRLLVQLKIFESDRALVLLGSSYCLIDATGRQLRIDRYPQDDTSIRWQLLFQNAFCHSSVMIRANVLKYNNIFYNEDCRYAQDYELWSRLVEYGKVRNCSEALVSYRVHQNNQKLVVYQEQQEIATRISISNVRKMGIKLNEQEMFGLRNFFSGKVSDDVVPNLYLIVDIYQMFSVYGNYSLRNSARIRFNLISHFLRMMALSRKKVGFIHCAWSLFMIGPLGTIFAMISHVLNLFGRLLMRFALPSLVRTKIKET